MKEEQKGEIIIYQTADGQTKIDVYPEDETVWLTQMQTGLLFGRTRRKSVVCKFCTRHSKKNNSSGMPEIPAYHSKNNYFQNGKSSGVANFA